MLTQTPAHSLAPVLILLGWSMNTVKQNLPGTELHRPGNFFLLQAGSVSCSYLEFDNHSHMIWLLYSFPVICFSISLNHYCSIDIGFLYLICCNMSYIRFLSFHSVKHLRNLTYCQFFIFTCFNQFYLCAEIKHSAFLWRSWLQLNENVKNLWL